MKTLKHTGTLCLLLLSFCLASCSTDETPQPVEDVITDPITDSLPDNSSSELKLFAIDTARIYALSATGVKGATIVNRMVNLNSYIGGMSISADGTKLAYINTQREYIWEPEPIVNYTLELRVANVDGTNDQVIYSSNEPYINITALRFCTDNKIFFSTETPMPDLVRKLYTINSDGTGQELLTGMADMADVSDDRQYYLTIPYNSSSVIILDKNGDNGAGSLYHNEPFTTAQTLRSGVFTDNGKYAVIPFTEGNELKIRIIDMAAKSSSTKTLVTGLGSGWLAFHLEMAADSNRGIVTLTGSDYTKSKSYVFNLETGAVDMPFENSNENIFDVYIN